VSHVLAFLFLLSAESIAVECSVDKFLGPLPGLKYIYSGSDGSKIELTGISSDENKMIEVEEIVFFPENILPPDVPKTTSNKYRLFIDGNKIIKETVNVSKIVLQGPLTKESTEWKIKGKAGSKTDQEETKWKDIESICKIVESHKNNIFGKERYTITVKCVTSNSLSPAILIETYAEDIGLIVRIIKGMTKGGEPRELYRLTLEKILNMKCIE
jgi:hypothetical protein